jgi:predicted MFS family arabinose efflux permease
MAVQVASEHDAASPRAPGWGAVFALTLCVATLIASEFMPVSLLTPIATDLHMTEGHAGQAIAVSGIFAVLTSLGISSATRGIDRRIVLLSLTLLMMASGVMVAFAPNAGVFMAGRALIGIVIGGFWSMSAATVMRLVPEADVPRAMGMLNGGNALATTVAAPVGSFLGQYVGWRGAFFSVVPLAALTLGWLFATLPSMPSERGPGGGSVFRVLRRRQVPSGMMAVTLFFLGQFALYTYLRPFLETVTGVDVSTLSLILLIIGGAGLLGTWLIGLLLRTRLYSLLVAMPIAMAAIAIVLTVLGGSPVAVAVLLAGWGLVSTAAPVGWWTWLSKVLPDDAEAGGGLMVAVIQMAIAVGATAGGVIYDTSGYRSTFAISAAALCVSALLAAMGWRQAQRKQGRVRGNRRTPEAPLSATENRDPRPLSGRPHRAARHQVLSADAVITGG